MAAPLTKPMCRGSDASNTSGVGGRFAPDQKGFPEDVTLSTGKLCNSCGGETEQDRGTKILPCDKKKSIGHVYSVQKKVKGLSA